MEMIKETGRLAIWCGATVALGAATCDGAQDWVRITGNGCQIVVEAEGVSKFTAVSSAGYQTRRVGSQRDPMIGGSESSPTSIPRP